MPAVFIWFQKDAESTISKKTASCFVFQNKIAGNDRSPFFLLFAE
jgi:hypothetical protein